MAWPWCSAGLITCRTYLHLLLGYKCIKPSSNPFELVIGCEPPHSETIVSQFTTTVLSAVAASAALMVLRHETGLTSAVTQSIGEQLMMTSKRGYLLLLLISAAACSGRAPTTPSALTP